MYTQEERLSTPHGALGTLCGLVKVVYLPDLSTPHGALGTFHLATSFDEYYNVPFNSTRCIRNQKIDGLTFVKLELDLSTPHGALGTPGPAYKEIIPKVFQLHTVH